MKKIIFLHFETYIAMIKNSVGSKMFRTAYILEDGKVKDDTEDGELSCAFYESHLLNGFNLIKEGHLTVNGLEKDLLKSGWYKIKKPRIGAIIIWEPEKHLSGRTTRHVGFYIGNNKAISHRDHSRTPEEHHWLYQDEGINRKAEAIYWHKKLAEWKQLNKKIFRQENIKPG